MSENTKTLWSAEGYISSSVLEVGGLPYYTEFWAQISEASLTVKYERISLNVFDNFLLFLLCT